MPSPNPVRTMSQTTTTQSFFTSNETDSLQSFESTCGSHLPESDIVTSSINENCFENITVLGTGGYGKVVLVRKRNGPDSGRLYAMKTLPKWSVLQKAKMVEHVLTERKVLEAVGKSKFLVTLHYAFQSENRLHLVMDYVSGGELFTHLQRRNKFSENVVRFYMAEMILALGHLHGLKIIYRDLKLENVMLDSRGHIVLTDFGLSKIFAPDDKACHTFSFCGTIEYMAPEIINVTSKGYTFAVDWWSLGVLSYELASGKSPFALGNEKNSHSEIAERVVGGRLPSFSGIATDLQDILGKLMERNPRRRLGYNGPVQVCKHRFFKSVDWEKLYNQQIAGPVIPVVRCDVDTRNFLKEFTKLPINDRSPCPVPDNGQVFLDFDYELSTSNGCSALFTSNRPRTNQMRSIVNSSPFFKTYELIDNKGYLGEGTHSTCRRCYCRSSLKELAVKILPKEHFRREEMENLNRLQGCPLVVKMEDVIEDKLFVYVVMEPLFGSDLLQRMFKQNDFRLGNAKVLITNVVSAVRLMHAKSVVHGNLRPEKLVFHSDGECSNMRIVGFSNSQTTMGDFNFRSQFGSAAAASQVAGQCRRMLESLDWWAVGLIMYIVVHGQAPSVGQQALVVPQFGDNAFGKGASDLLRKFDAVIMGLLSTDWQIRALAWDQLIASEMLSSTTLFHRIPTTALDFEQCRRIKNLCDVYLGARGILSSHLLLCPEVQLLLSEQQRHDDVDCKPCSNVKPAVKRKYRRKRPLKIERNLKRTAGKKKNAVMPAPSTHTMKLRSSKRRSSATSPVNHLLPIFLL